MSKANITKLNVINTLKDNYMPYSMSVIMSRALPEIDGLKPSHRKLLYTMYKMGLLKGTRTKSANIVGSTMRLNPHGDSAIYETMVRLTRGNEALLAPYIDSKGNFGKVYSRDMSYAAARYTEARLEKISEELFNDINKDTVDFVPNYDNTTTEPKLLPTTFPNILVNPNIGIAVGMACSIPSFNLKEVCQTAIKLLESKTGKINFAKWLPAPDFSTGGELIYNKGTIEKIYSTGRGSFQVRAKYDFDKNNNCIEIIEIPYSTTIESVIEKVTSLIKDNTIKDITDIRDETDKNGLKITIDLKRNTDPHKLMKILYKKTPLKDSFSCNFNILVNGSPKVLGIGTILEEWIKFRINCIKRQIKYDIDKKSQRLHLLKGLKKILLDIDKAVQIVKDTKQDIYVIPNLMKGFEIDKEQAEFIADIKLRNFNQEYIINKTKDIENLESDLKELKQTLNNDDKIKNIIKEELKKVIKTYGQNRKTKLVDEEDIEHITEEQMVEDYNLKFFLTNEGYLKKVPLVSLRGANKQKLKDNDNIIQEIEGTNKSELLLFSNKHTVYKIKSYELEDTKTSSLGDYLPNILGLDNDEKIIYIVSTIDFRGYMLFFFENGKASKIEISSYETKTNRSKLSNAYYDKEKLIYITYLAEDKEMVAISSIYKVLIFNTEQINSKTTRNSQGIQVLKSKKGSTLKEIKCIEDVEYKDFDYYRGNIPAIGTYLKKEDKENQQEQLTML